MTQDEIIRMAREAGASQLMRLDGEYVDHYQLTGNDVIERFANLVAEAKDKEIAELAEKYQRVACAYLELSEKVKETGVKNSKWGIE